MFIPRILLGAGFAALLAGPAAANVTLYQHCDYRGYQIALGPGAYDLQPLQSRGMRNDDVSSVRVPRGWRVTLYEHAGFRGRSRTLTADDGCFTTSNFNDILSSVRVERLPPPVATLYQHCNFRGYEVGLSEGSFDLGELRNRGMRNDDVSALRVAPGWRVRLYEHAGFRGRSRVVAADDACFTTSNFNDILSSVRVERAPPPVATLYQHCNFRGYQVGLSAGSFDLGELRALGMVNDDVSALRVAPGWRVTLYEHAGFRGRSRTVTADDACFTTSNFNDILSSVRVERAPPPRITLYQHCDFRGYEISLDAGDFDLRDLERRGMRNDDISSIRVPPGMQVTLYEHAGFRGRTHTMTTNDRCFTRFNFNDILSSVRVRRR